MSLSTWLLNTMSATAVSSTFALFLCGIPICRRIAALGTADTTPGAPFLVAFISCVLWTQYGFTREDEVIIAINFIGVATQTAYVLFYYSWSSRQQKRRLRKILGTELLAIVAVEYMVHAEGWKESGENILGIVCVILNVTNMGAPLLAVGEVLRQRSTSMLPLPLCTANLVVSLQWLLYGTLMEDRVIQVPNVMATCLSVLQLSLFAIFPRNGSAALAKGVGVKLDESAYLI